MYFYFQGFEVQKLHRWEVSCRVVSSNICCLDIPSKKQSANSIVTFSIPIDKSYTLLSKSVNSFIK